MGLPLGREICYMSWTRRQTVLSSINQNAIFFLHSQSASMAKSEISYLLSHVYLSGLIWSAFPTISTCLCLSAAQSFVDSSIQQPDNNELLHSHCPKNQEVIVLDRTMTSLVNTERPAALYVKCTYNHHVALWQCHYHYPSPTIHKPSQRTNIHRQ